MLAAPETTEELEVIAAISSMQALNERVAVQQNTLLYVTLQSPTFLCSSINHPSQKCLRVIRFKGDWKCHIVPIGNASLSDISDSRRI